MPRGNTKSPFLKGNKMSPGRPKGVPLKISLDRMNKINEVLSIIEEKHLLDDIQKLSPSKRVELWSDLLEFVKPKLQRIDMTIEKDERTLTQLIVIPATQQNITLNSEGKLLESFGMSNEDTLEINENIDTIDNENS